MSYDPSIHNLVWENKYAKIYTYKNNPRNLWDYFNKKLLVDDLFMEIKKLYMLARKEDEDNKDGRIVISPDLVIKVGRFNRNNKTVNIYSWNPCSNRLKNTWNVPAMPEGNFSCEQVLSKLARSINTRLIVASEPIRKEVAARLAKQDEAEDKLKQWETELKKRFVRISCNYDSDRYKFSGTIEIMGIKQEYNTTGALLDFQPRLSLTPEQTEEFFTILNRWKRQNDERRKKEN